MDAWILYYNTHENILKNRPVPGRLSNSTVMCKSLKSYGVSFICDLSISSKFHCDFLSPVGIAVLGETVCDVLIHKADVPNAANGDVY